VIADLPPTPMSDDTAKIYYARSPSDTPAPFHIVLGLGIVTIVVLIVFHLYMLALLWSLALATALLWLRNRSRPVTSYLRLSAEAVEYKSPDLHILTTWSNVKSLSYTLLGPSLLLYQAAAITNHSKVGYATLWAALADREIPLYEFEYNEPSELMADIRRYAPQLGQYLRTPK
jgi:hypothetical protein